MTGVSAASFSYLGFYPASDPMSGILAIAALVAIGLIALWGYKLICKSIEIYNDVTAKKRDRPLKWQALKKNFPQFVCMLMLVPAVASIIYCSLFIASAIPLVLAIAFTITMFIAAYFPPHEKYLVNIQSPNPPPAQNPNCFDDTAPTAPLQPLNHNVVSASSSSQPQKEDSQSQDPQPQDPQLQVSPQISSPYNHMT